MERKYNMNKEMILLSELPFGTTKTEVKIGRNFYEVKIDKNQINASVTMKGYCVPVKKDAVIEREFLEEIDAIWNAMRMVKNNRRVLYLV